MPQTTGDLQDPYWKRSPVAMEEKDPGPGEERDPLPMITLQAPPKCKSKRQMSADSHPQKGIGRPDHFVPAFKGHHKNTWKFSNSPTDRTQRLPVCDFLQPHEASFTLSHSLPSSTSSPFSSNFSPKKFRSHYGPIPSPSRTYEAVISPRNAPSLQKNLDKVCRCITENCHADSASTFCHSSFAKVPIKHVKDSQNAAFLWQTEMRKSFGHLETNYFNHKPSRCRSAQNLAFEDSNLRTQPPGESHGMTEVDLSDTQGVEPTRKSHTHNSEPDVFVFPDCLVKEAASSQDRRRMNTRDTDEVFLDCKTDESNCPHQDQKIMSTRERDKVFKDCKTDSSSGSYQASRRINKDTTDEPDGLDSPMDTDDYSFQSSYGKLTTKQNILSKSRPQDSRSLNHNTPQSAVNESCTFIYDKHYQRSMTFERDTHPVRVHNDIASDEDIIYSNRTMAPLNRMLYEQFPRNAYEPRTHERNVLQRESSAWSSNCSAAEVVDTSESDDISQYLEDHESMLSEWPGYVQSFTRTSDSKNSRVPKNNQVRRAVGHPEDDYPVKTTADTNVSYISLNDLSTSSDDMEYEYDDDDVTTYSGHMSRFFDHGDEPDGKAKKLEWGQKTDDVPAGQRYKFLVVGHAGPVKQANDHVPVSDCLQPATYLREEHPLAVSLPGNPQVIVANKESAYHEKISFIVEDTCRTPNRTVDHATSSPSPESDGCKQNARSTHDNKREQHYHHLSRSKNMKRLFQEPSKQKVENPLNSVERKQLTGVTCTDSQIWHHYAYNNNNNNNNNNGFGINNEQFADEVDGLGDKTKIPHHKQRADSQAASPRQSNEEQVIHCFDRNNTGNDTATSRPTAVCVTNVPDGANTSHDTPTSRGTLQEKHQASPVVDAVTLSTREMADSLKEAPGSCGNFLKRTNPETNTQERKVQGYSRHPDMLHREIHGNVSHKKQSDTNKEHTTVCQSPNAQLRRRKSDTSVGDFTESGLSRSQSSPSKLGLTEDTAPSTKPVLYHRPWLEQNIPQQKTLISTSTPNSRINSSCLSATIPSGSHTNSAPAKRMIFPTNAEYTSASSKQTFDNDNSNDEITGNRGNPYSDRSKRSTRKSEDATLIASKDQQPGSSAGSGQSPHKHHKRRTEGRPKRKLEFSMQESRNLQPPAQRQAREVIALPSVQNQTEPEGVAAECLHQEHEVSRGQVKGKTANWHEEVTPSTSSSRSQAEESRPSPRNDDEVDIRVQITDVLQESTRLLQHLEVIYQADDRDCSCSRIEQNILRSALDMFRALGNEASSREYWMDQLHQTNDVINKTLELAENFRRLCRHGRQVTDVFPGSIFIRIKCRTVLSLVDLCDMHTSGDLQRILFNILSQSVVLDKPGVTLTVTLDKSNIMTCQEYLLTRMDKDAKTRPGTRGHVQNKMAPVRAVSSAENLLYSSGDAGSPSSHAVVDLGRSPLASVSQHAPSCAFSSQRERKFSFGEINRTAFQELNISDVTSPTSPSFGRLLRDDPCLLLGKPDLVLASSARLNSPNLLSSPKLLNSPVSSPLTSPRKLNVCDVISEQENIDHNKE